MGKQKRSENTYQKINTIFMRDAKNVIMPYESFTEPEFEYLRGLKWRAEEKIDGTNMRIEVTKVPIWDGGIEGRTINGVEFKVRIAGKTDNTQIPKNLLKHMQEKYPNEKVLAALGLKEFIPVEEWENEHNWLTYEQIPNIYTIYGEGYGEGIQSGGWYIKGGNEFIVFDVKVNDIYLRSSSNPIRFQRLSYRKHGCTSACKPLPAASSSACFAITTGSFIIVVPVIPHGSEPAVGAPYAS